ncbi:MAG: hypothetical protein VX777_08830 [Chlamydiota bacterium]|nr:hypothetical protein [Chlamydiota bacterium]
MSSCTNTNIFSNIKIFEDYEGVQDYENSPPIPINSSKKKATEATQCSVSPLIPISLYECCNSFESYNSIEDYSKLKKWSWTPTYPTNKLPLLIFTPLIK